MKVYIVADNVCVELAKDYLLVICTKAEFDTLSVPQQLDKIKAVLAGYAFDILDTQGMTLN